MLRRLRTAVAAALVVATAGLGLLPAEASAKPVRKFQFSFNKQKDAQPWDPTIGKWDVRGGSYWGRFEGAAILSRLERGPFRRVRASVNLIVPESGRVGVMLRSKGRLTIDGYAVVVTYAPAQSSVQVLKLRAFDMLDGSGKVFVLGQTGFAGASPGDMRTLKAAVEGSIIKVWAPGQFTFEVHDSSFDRGEVGLFAADGEPGQEIEIQSLQVVGR